MVFRGSLLVLFIVVATLAVAVPASASFTLGVEDASIEEPVLVGETGTVSVTITASSSETMVCPNGGALSIGLAVDGDGDGFGGDISPSSVDFMIDSGAYGGALGPWEGGSQTATFTATISDEIPHNDHQYDVVATYDASQPGDCATTGEWSEASATGSVSVTAEQPPADEETENDTDDDTQGGADTEGSPGPTIGILLVGLFAAIVARRRR